MASAKFGPKQLGNKTPVWATTAFKITVILTTVAGFIISGDTTIAAGIKNQINNYLGGLDLLVLLLAQLFGVDVDVKKPTPTKARTVRLYAALLIFIAFGYCSCNAVTRVLKDPAKKEKVGREWEKANPCVNDTMVAPGELIFIKGKDSSFPVYIKAVDYKFKTLDTLIKGSKVKVDTNGNILISLKVCRPDTIIRPVNHYVTDNRRLNIANDSVAYYARLSAFNAQQAARYRQQLTHAEWTTNLWKLAFYALLSAAILFKFRFKLLSLITP